MDFSVQVALWIGVFSLIVAVLATIVILAKALNAKPLFDTIKEVLNEFKGSMKETIAGLNDAVSELSSYVKECRMEDRLHQEQAKRTHEEIHAINLNVLDISGTVTLLDSKLEKVGDKLELLDDKFDKIEKLSDKIQIVSEKIDKIPTKK